MGQHWGALFGAEVRYKRVKLGLESQQKLAERLNYKNHATITQIEMGNVMAHFDVAMEIAKYLQIDLNAIMGITPTPHRDNPAGPPPEMSDPVLVRMLAMLEKLWPWPQAQRQAMIAVWRALATALEEWPAPEGTEEPRPESARPEDHPVRPHIVGDNGDGA